MAIQGASVGMRAVAQRRATCRQFGISHRRSTDGNVGTRLKGRPVWRISQPPSAVAPAMSQEVVSKILYLWQTAHFDPGTIADYLKRFHQEIW